MKLIFDLYLSLLKFRYDFDKDGQISKDDVGLLLSHAPIEKLIKEVTGVKEGQFTKSGGGREEYIDRAQSQIELQNLVNVCFVDKVSLNFEDFKRVADCVTFEMFFCIFSIVKKAFPSLAQLKRYEQGLKKNSECLIHSPAKGRKMAPPKILSKFSPMVHMVKFSTPQVELHAMRVHKPDEEESSSDSKSPRAQKPYFLKLNSKQFPSLPNAANKPPMSPITPALRLANTIIHSKEIIKSPSLFLAGQKSDAILFCECGKEITDFDKLLCADCVSTLNQPKCEGYLSKQSKKKLTKYWMCVDKRDLFCISCNFNP